MLEEIKSTLREMTNPPVASRKKRIIGFLIGLPLGVLLMVYLGLPLWMIVTVTAALAVLIPLAFVWEIRSEKKGAAFKDAVESGAYFENDAWREKYRKYCETHDFEKVTAQTMRADLQRRYLKPSGIVLVVCSLGFFIPAAVWESGDTAINVILAFAGVFFLLWGIFKLRCTPVRLFLRKYAPELDAIERSYLNGKVLTFRCSGLSAENNGINIGGAYTVMWYRDGICAIENQRITSVTRRVFRTKYYNNGIYAGTGTKFLLCVYFRTAEGEDRWCRIRLNAFQAEMAYEALAPFRSAVEYMEHIRHDVG